MSTKWLQYQTSAAIEQVLMRGVVAPEAEALPSFVQVAENIIEKSIIQQSEVSSSNSLAQKVGQFLSLEPKPGYILIPGMNGNKQLGDCQSHEEKRESIRQIIMNRERDITIDEAHMLGFRGEKVFNVDSYDKVTGTIALNMESTGGAPTHGRTL